MNRTVQTQHGLIEIIGHDDALRMLDASLRDRVSVQLIGLAGVGKSTLLQWCRQEAEGHGYSCVAAPDWRTVPAEQWWLQVDDAFGISPGESGSTKFRSLLSNNSAAYLFVDDIDQGFERYKSDSYFGMLLAESLQSGMRLVCSGRKSIMYETADAVLASHFAAMKLVNVGPLSHADTTALARQIFGESLGALMTTTTATASGGFPGALEAAYEEWVRLKRDLNQIDASFEAAYLKYPWLRGRVTKRRN